ncbi:MAG: signal peptidase I [Candidatus Delongbacteria bacterium]|jgi:signal peptidase I|nr:signal peptidase I [Candidatus Delongbacteria bacterium]
MKKSLYIAAVIIIVFVFFMLKFHLVKSYNHDMLPSISKGEYVLVSRIPPDKMSRLNIIAYHFPGIADKKIRKKPVHLSRLMALPGDTIEIRNKKVYVNTDYMDKKLSLFYKYRISTDTSFNPNSLEKFNTLFENEIAPSKAWELFTSPKTASNINDLRGVTNVRFLSDLHRNMDYGVFPNSRFFNWNKDYFGPLVIPEVGKEIQINYMNINLYKRIIEVYENHNLIIKYQKIYIDGKEATTYIPEQNYYFVMDDNRDHCNDSRHWGFLPADHVAGIKTFQRND